MCFYSEPEVVAVLLEETAAQIRKMAAADENVSEDDVKRLGAMIVQVDFEISGCIASRSEADLDAVVNNFL